MKIYIAGQITGLDYGEAFANFEAAERLLWLMGHEPINPMVKNGLDGNGQSYSWSYYMRADIPLLCSCDAIYLQSNWMFSKGARLEHFIALELGLQMIYQGVNDAVI